MIEDPADDLIGSDVAGLGFVGEDDAVSKDGEGDGLDIVRRDEGPALEEGLGFGGQREGDGRAGRGPELNESFRGWGRRRGSRTLGLGARGRRLERGAGEIEGIRRAGGVNQFDDVIADSIVDVDLIDEATGFEEIGETKDVRGRGRR